MAIIGTLPNNIQNGQAADANPVMADFNFIVNQVNANANPTGTLTAPSGTRALFHQATAPSGWVQDVTITDHTIQIIATPGGAVGGGNGYSSMFGGPWTSDGHALTTAELAVHSHADGGHGHAVTDPTHFHSQSVNTWYDVAGGPNAQSGGGLFMATSSQTTQSASTGVTVNTGFANIQNTGSGNAHSHTKTFNSLFVQMIMCQKS